MAETNTSLAKAGDLLTEARIRSGLSGRKAATRAQISETRWRQIVTGVTRVAKVDRETVTTMDTLARMALAVNLDPATVLKAADITATEQELADAIRRWEQGVRVSELADARDHHAPEEYEPSGLETTMANSVLDDIFSRGEAVSTRVRSVRRINIDLTSFAPSDLSDLEWENLKLEVQTAATRAMRLWLAERES